METGKSASKATAAVTIKGRTVAIGGAAELVVVLDILQGKNDREVLRQIRDSLADLVRAPGDLLSLLRVLSAEDKLFLIESLGRRLPEAIGSAAGLRDILAATAQDQVAGRLISALGRSGLAALIRNAKDLGDVLLWLYGRGGALALGLTGNSELRRLVTCGEDLALILAALDRPGQNELLRRIGWPRIMSLIANGRDLAHVLRALPAGASIGLLKRYRRCDLARLIGNEHDWRYLYHRLEPAEARYLLRRLGADGHAA